MVGYAPPHTALASGRATTLPQLILVTGGTVRHASYPLFSDYSSTTPDVTFWNPAVEILIPLGGQVDVYRTGLFLDNTTT